jgi:hypothetical protein
MPGLIEKAGRFEIQKYRSPADLNALRETHVPYTGSPRKHPYDPEQIIVVSDPYSYSPHYFEFRLEDISYVEKLPNLVDSQGKTIAMARVWVKKMSVGVLCSPFVVEATRGKVKRP